MRTNIIVITGGVYSSLGKGIIASSIGCILKSANYKVSMLKLDPYLNAFPGKLSPYQHGEVFITTDGCEADLDLGHYERFTQVNQTQYSTTTSGKIYKEILEDEQKDRYDGKTIQVVPHVTNKIIAKVEQAIKNVYPDFLIIEIGGTIGDIESLPYIEALRIYNLQTQHKILFVHAAPLLQLEANNELKTKPTQHSIKLLRNLGINPSLLVLRNKTLLAKEDKEKLSWTCDIEKENIFVSLDCHTLYDVPKILHEQKIDKQIFKYFGIKNKKVNMNSWNNFLSTIHSPKSKKIKIAIYGYYSKLSDAYLSLMEALKLTCYRHQVGLEIILLDNSNKNEIDLKAYDGIILYGDIGAKIDFATLAFYQLCCEQKINFLGIDLGLQVMIALALQELKAKDIFIKNKDAPRLGSKSINIVDKNSYAYNVYRKEITSERHRDCFSFNQKYLSILETKLKVSATSNDKNNFYVEIVENPNASYNVGILFHPEYEVKPFYGHPILENFIEKLIK